MSKTKSKDLLEHPLSLNEMAKVGEFSDGKIMVYSEDHDPPHIHFLKDDILIAKVVIPTKDIKNLSDVVIKEKGAAYKDYLITSLIKWMNQVGTKRGVKAKNWRLALILWDALHNK